MSHLGQMAEAAGTMGAIGSRFVPLLVGHEGQNGGHIKVRQGQDSPQEQTDLGQAQAQCGRGREQVGQHGGRLQTRRGGQQHRRPCGGEQSCCKPPLSGGDAVASAPGSGGPG